MEIHEIKELIRIYGENTTLIEILKQVQGNKIHKCPKCNGKGFVIEKYNKIPYFASGGGMISDIGEKHINCDLCNGQGYTEHEYKPKIIQDGWK